MALFRRVDSPFWWYSYKVNGVRVQYSTGTPDRKLAQEIYFKERSNAVAGIKFPIKIKFRLFDMIDLYLKDCSRVSKVMDSFRQDLSHSIKIKEFFGNCLLSDIIPHKIELYRAHRLKSVGRARVNRGLAFLRHMFTKAIEWEKWAGENPVKKIKPFKEERKPERYLSYDERESLFKVSPEFLKPILLTALKTGMRQREILNLKWEDVDLQRAVIHVRHTKAHKLRQIPIHPMLEKVLNKIPSKSEYVFSDKNGKKLSQNGLLRGAFERAVNDAKILNFTFHDLRHTFASELIMKGVDIKTVQEYLGHSSVSVTERYVHIAPTQKRMAIQLLGNEKYEKCNASATLKFEKVVRNGREYFKIPNI